MFTPNTYDGFQLLHQGAMALAVAEVNGIRIDMDYCHKTDIELKRKMEELEWEIKSTRVGKLWQKECGKEGSKFTLKKDDQLRTVLYKRLKIKPIKGTGTGKGSVDAETLQLLTDQAPDLSLLLKWKKLDKIRGTYFAQILREVVDGYLHPSFNLHVPISYRSSSSDPNFQNQPARDPMAKKYVRRAFVARKGRHLLEYDVSGAEVVTSCWYHKDPTMIAYVLDDDKDMHRDMAMKIYKLPKKEMTKAIRHAGKNSFVFPNFYGSYYENTAADLWQEAKTLETSSGIPMLEWMDDHGIGTYQKFITHIERIERWFWNEMFPVYKQWKVDTWDFYQKNGYVGLLSGFKCTDITLKKNEVINRPIQGTAFHCLLWGLVEMQMEIDKRGLDTKIIGQIHDSLIMDVPEKELQIVLNLFKHIMNRRIRKHWPWIIVPLDVEPEASPKDGSWYDKKPMVLENDIWRWKEAA